MNVYPVPFPKKGTANQETRNIRIEKEIPLRGNARCSPIQVFRTLSRKRPLTIAKTTNNSQTKPALNIKTNDIFDSNIAILGF
jgi:hypothetical protein